MGDHQRQLKRVLFVCTGNVCRSPMAEGLLRQLAKWRNLPIEVRSAGTHALVGEPATKEAVATLSEMGITIADHRAQQVTKELLTWADLVLTMESEHRLWILNAWSDVEDKVFTLSEFVGRRGAIEDPYGGGKEAYRLVKDLLIDLILDLVDRLKEDRGTG